MAPKTKQLFISYRSTDAATVDDAAKALAAATYPDGAKRYIPWQDKHNLPPASPNWWDAILDALIASDVFVFFMSKASLQSVVCMAELDYAHKRNRVIVPVVLEYSINPSSKKAYITYPELIPAWLNDVQWLFYAQHDFLAQFQTAMENREGRWPLDTPAKRPLNPDGNSSHRTNHALYDDACDYAEKLLFSQAEELFRALVRRDDPDYAPVAHQWLELLGRYAELIEVHERRNARFLFKPKWDEYQALFPKDFLEGVFDPKGLGGEVVPPPPPVQPPVQPPAPPVKKPEPPTDPVQAALKLARDFAKTGKRNRDWTPFLVTFSDLKIPKMPFCLVPTGTFQMGSDDYDDEKPIHPQTVAEPFYIAQYPVTNAQWRVAVTAGVVGEPQTEKSKRWYDDPQMANAPVVGISWFEAHKFVQWAGCRLLTEREWEYAARGVESWVYPRGNDWDADKAIHGG
ncbi:MAG: SUMF1/EgtB/PvdO family nonheme iron enzyme, partial [Anaerolineae bacterium]|nr:SUMF1/EgtB/PvdO family nonheme iron enzyme [Anaerolineae bacterium]